MQRYQNNRLPRSTAMTIGVEFGTKNVMLKDGTTVKAQLWDTAGQEKYRAITVAHYRNAVGALVVYDVTRSSTFQNVKYWIESLCNSAECDICVVIVGNKVDIVREDPTKRQVTAQMAQDLAASYPEMHIKCKETSATAKINVTEVFEELLHDIYNRR